MTKLFIIMGVSGTGKTTIGTMLSDMLGIPFYDGDDYHPQANVVKMASGRPLNDDDRHDWLVTLNNLLNENRTIGAIIACSALKKSYRSLLQKGIEEELCFIYLKGSFEEVKTRLEKRKGHFMPLELLKSQFDTLEEPKNALTISIMQTPKEIISKIKKQLQKQ